MYIDIRKEKNTHSYIKNNEVYPRSRIRTYCIFKCDNCHKCFERLKGSCFGKDNNEHQHFCSECSSPSIKGALGKKKINEIWRKKIGEKQIDSCGYITVYVANTHPYSDGYCGRVREHILVMENHLNRQLNKGEVVHHIDGNKTNNDIDNLDLCSVQQHNQCHAKIESIVFELYRRGKVGYDKETKSYFLKE